MPLNYSTYIIFKLFDNQKSYCKEPDQLVNQAIEALWGFQQAKRRDETHPSAYSDQHKWQKPPPGMQKVNIDVAIFEQENTVGLGMVIRDNSDGVVAART